MIRVADFIAEYIYKLGVHDVFMVSGGGMMFLSDGLAQKTGFNVICPHHEQAAAMAAVGYAKYHNSFGVAYVTTGCGGTNAITGLLDAWQDNIPCLFISGQCKRKETVRNSGLPLRQFGVQEVDIVAVVQPLTKYAEMVNDPSKIAWHLDRAVYLARSGRPGPVWLDIPMDVQGTLIDETALERFDPASESMDFQLDPSPDAMATVAELLRTSQRPIIVAGQGIRLAEAIPLLKVFVETSGIPVVASRLGIDMLPSAHPLFIGRIGNKGDRAGNFSVQNADLVLVLGSRLSVSSTGHEYQTFAREAKIVIVDIDPVEHSKNTVRVDCFINADAKRFLNQITKSGLPDYSAWSEKCLAWKNRWPVCLPEYAASERVNLYYFVDCLTRSMKDNATVVADAGSAFYVVSQAAQFNGNQRYITSGGQADMGFTLPAAIGACVASGNREVLAITGDGSFQMNIQELQTIVHNHLPIKLFVWNNDGYLSIRASQSKFFEGRFIGTDSTSGLSFPDTSKIAGAYGIPFFRINNSDELPNMLGSILSTEGPAIIEVMCIRDQEIVPTVSSWKKADGTMVSRPLEDMYPFLDREEFRSEMIIKPLDD